MKPEHIDITVDRLVVEGLDSNSARTLGHAFETELSRLLEAEGLPAGLEQPGDQPAIEIPALPLSSETRPDIAGRRLASAVYRELKR